MKNSFISSFENNRKYKVKVYYVILFIFIFTSSLVFIEVLNRSFYSQLSENVRNLKHFNEQKKSVELLFVGDSHFKYGIDLTFFNYSAFDLSFNGANLIQSYYILKYYIEKMESLELVIIPLDLHTFSSFQRITDPVFWNRFIDYSELIEIKGLGILRNKFVITVLTESTGKKSFIMNLVKFILRSPFFRDMRFARSLTSEPSQVLDADKAIRRAKFHLHNQRVLDKDLLIYFGKMLKLCEENNVKVITLQMPMSREYLRCAKQYITGDRIRTNVLENPQYRDYIYRHFDYLELYQDRRECFMDDGDHLNRIGRKLFSKLLSQEIPIDK